MATQGRKLYTSSSGDSWYLCRGRKGEVVVSHEPNVASGGKSSQIDLVTFLSKHQGPEHLQPQARSRSNLTSSTRGFEDVLHT